MILRTSWVYSLRKGGFVNKVIEWSRKQPVLRIVDDQTGNPTWARMLAEATAMLVVEFKQDLVERLSACAGIYHLAGDGHATRYEWVREILRLTEGFPGRLADSMEPARSSDFPTPAKRPPFSALDCTKFTRTFGLSLPAWQEALQLALAGL